MRVTYPSFLIDVTTTVGTGRKPRRRFTDVWVGSHRRAWPCRREVLSWTGAQGITTRLLDSGTLSHRRSPHAGEGPRSGAVPFLLLRPPFEPLLLFSLACLATAMRAKIDRDGEE